MNVTNQTLAISVKLFLFFLGVLLVNVLVIFFLRHSQDGVFTSIETIAAWLEGGTKPEVVTWPAWGYACLVKEAPSLGALVATQALVGALALTALTDRLWQNMPQHRVIITSLFLLAIPWHTMQVTLYPSALAGSLTLIALLLLDGALSKNTIKWAFIAGLFAGLGQNMRTEFVLFPAFLGIGVVVLRRFGIMKFPSIKPFVVFIFTALALQLPWATFYYEQTGRFSFTESNLGHVLFVSLGSVPNNPWGINGDDRGAGEAVKEAGYPYSSLSEQGNQILKHIVLEKAKEYPSAIVKRTFQQFKNSLLAPFNWGEPNLDAQGLLDLDVLREELKSHLGVGVNVRELQQYRERDLLRVAQKNLAAIGAMIYQFFAVSLGSLIMLFGIAGILLVLIRPKIRPTEPLIFLLGFAVFYKILLDVLLCYQINYLNNVYPMFIPFVSITIVAIRSRLLLKPRLPVGSSIRILPEK